MKHQVFIFSGANTLYLENAKTSSEKHEISIIRALSGFFKTTIVSYNDIELEEKNENLSVLKLPREKNYKNLSNRVLASTTIDNYSIIIFFGYNPMQVNQIYKIKKKAKCKCFTFLYDHHNAAILTKHFLSRVLLNALFNLSLKKINKMDGVFLFNKNAINFLKIKIPHLITKPFLEEKDSFIIDKPRGPFNSFVFAGTLNKYNCIKEIVVAATNANVKLDIYGDGPLKHEIIPLLNEKIIYHGVVNDAIVREKIKNNSCILCLRSYDKFISNVSYPSKFVDAIKYGVPIIINNKEFLCGKDSFNNVFEVKACSIEEITKSFKSIKDFKINESYYLDRNRLSNIFSKEKEIESIVSFLKGFFA